MPEKKKVPIKDIKVRHTPLEIHLDENIKWKNEEFGLFKHYGGESLKDQIVRVCADLEETALRIQYGLCKPEDKTVSPFMHALFDNIENECRKLLSLIVPINQKLKALREKES